MKDFSFGLATRDDDPAIRRLLAENPVPGEITVTYEREPDYFLGCGTMGRFWQVLVARHTPTGRIIGLACRATRPMFINGMIEEVGYLGHLRVDKRYRGRWLVAFGMRFFRELHNDGRVSGYMTTIVEENDVARGLLVDRPRPHHAIYREVGQLNALAIILRKPVPLVKTPHQIERITDAGLDDVSSFLKAHGRHKNFFPAYEADDFRSGYTMPDLCGDTDIFVARRHDEIVGVIGLWDQSRFKQTVVQAYSGTMRLARPFYNTMALLRGGPPLPAPGDSIHHIYACPVCVERNDPLIFNALLGYVYNEAVSRKYAYLSIGLDSRDPLLPVAKRYAHIAYLSRVYTVCWDQDGEFHARLDQRIPYIEIATL